MFKCSHNEGANEQGLIKCAYETSVLSEALLLYFKICPQGTHNVICTLSISAILPPLLRPHLNEISYLFSLINQRFR